MSKLILVTQGDRSVGTDPIEFHIEPVNLVLNNDERKELIATMSESVSAFCDDKVVEAYFDDQLGGNHE
jgi:hypothetical protein